MIFFFAKQANSKVTNNDLNENELTNYLSAIISYNNQQNQDSLSYFNKIYLLTSYKSESKKSNSRNKNFRK